MPVIEADPLLNREAMRVLYSRYEAIIAEAGPDKTYLANGRLSLSNLAWMCRTALEQMDSLPIDKPNRWLGFIQGCLAMRGLIDVDQERNVSRPLFHAAYGGSEKAPPSLSQDGT
jgi:hypothetical protein